MADQYRKRLSIMSEKLITIIKRFGRAFVSGGLGALVVALSTSPGLATLGDLKVWLTTLAIAFLAGGISALDKLARWQDQL